MNTSRTLLGLLSREPSYGYDLKHSYDRYFGAGKALAFGQVYSTLARMVRDELIRALGEETGGGPDRKKYEITAAGQDRVREWLFTPVVPSEFLQSELFAKTVIALLLDDDADRLLDVQRSEHMARMRELTRMKKDADLLQVLMCDHGLFHIEADLRWIDLTSARLIQLKAAPEGMSTNDTTAPILSARGLRHSFGIPRHCGASTSMSMQGRYSPSWVRPDPQGLSMLLHCLAGVLVPDGGSVTYRPAGRSPMETSALGEPKRARLRLTDFGFVFQFGQLLPELTAVDNVSLPLLLAGTRRAEALRRSSDLLARLGLDGMGAKLPGELSGGQAQRVAVARAMVTSLPCCLPMSPRVHWIPSPQRTY